MSHFTRLVFCGAESVSFLVVVVGLRCIHVASSSDNSTAHFIREIRPE